MLKTALQKLALYNDLVKSKRTTPEEEKKKAMAYFDSKEKFPEEALDFNFWKEASLFRKLAQPYSNESIDARITPINENKPVKVSNQTSDIAKAEKDLTKELNKSVGEGFPNLGATTSPGGFAGALLDMPPSVNSAPGINAGVNAALPGGSTMTSQMIQPTPQQGSILPKQKA